MITGVEPLSSGNTAAVLIASLLLVGLGVVLSLWWRLRLERTIVWAALRAAAQLMAAGVLLSLLLDSLPLAWLWVFIMVGVAAWTTSRRSQAIPGVLWISALAIGGSTLLALLIVFGLGLLPVDPIGVVVTAGITIGNTLPATVLAVNRAGEWRGLRRGELEALLALGFGRAGISRFAGRDVAGAAIVPQVERTKVVGLIALPGAMTGLLLAGIDPQTAVVAQLAIMYLILGAVVVSTAVVTLAALRGMLTEDLRILD